MPAVSTLRWALRAHGERTLPLSSSLVCPRFRAACGSPYATSAPRFHLLLQGTNAQDAPVELSIDVAVPPSQLRVRNP